MNINSITVLMDRLAKYIGTALLLYGIYDLVLQGMLDAMYFYGLAGSALAGLGIHAAVVTPYSKPASQPTAVIFGKKE